MPAIDRDKVGRAFGRRAGEYDRHAVVQKRVVARLLEQLGDMPAPCAMLDIGTGTGMLLGRLMDRYPAARAVGVDLAPAMAEAARASLAGRGAVEILVADAERLPFADGAFDLVVSSSTFQWLETLQLAFGEAHRVLAPGGRFRFALFGGQTLRELKASFRLALAACGGGTDRTHRCVTVEDVLTALGECGFADCAAHAELETEYHADARAVLRAIKRVGAGNASAVPSSGLAGRRVTQEMLAIYDREYQVEGRVPATYEVIYGWGMKPG
jgi:malonyl-CoA O-methyltransferase